VKGREEEEAGGGREGGLFIRVPLSSLFSLPLSSLSPSLYPPPPLSQACTAPPAGTFTTGTSRGASATGKVWPQFDHVLTVLNTF
jgi:hypothetical protein